MFELADAAGPLAQIAVTKKQGTWHWQKLGQDVVCRVDGEEVAEGSALEGLFIAFRDATTSRETYGAGRYLQIDEPQTEEFVLDFNRAFNPLCNYSDAYNCTLPLRENHLKVAINAGEKTYPH